jgi:hypothetical protein
MKRINLLISFSLISMAFLLSIVPQTIFPAGKKSDDKQQIIRLEVKWLSSLHSKAGLDTILAPGFIHPIPQGIFLTKDEHINWAINHPDLSGNVQKFDTLFIRIYNNTGIGSGIVATYDIKGKIIRRSIFTDIFIKMKGRWQAVSAQENLIK